MKIKVKIADVIGRSIYEGVVSGMEYIQKEQVAAENVAEIITSAVFQQLSYILDINQTDDLELSLGASNQEEKKNEQ